MRAALAGLERYIATPRVTKHRLFAWLSAAVLADSRYLAEDAVEEIDIEFEPLPEVVDPEHAMAVDEP